MGRPWEHGWWLPLQVSHVMRWVQPHERPTGAPASPTDYPGDTSLSALAREQHGHEFVFVTDFPISVRPFYHLRPADNPDVTASFDLMWKGVEITTGAQREHRYDVLCKQAEEKGLGLEPLRPYLDCFRFGMPTHGGLGAGLNRILMLLLGLDSIRESTFLFRGPNRLEP